jgi:hypothetical protein
MHGARRLERPTGGPHRWLFFQLKNKPKFHILPKKKEIEKEGKSSKNRGGRKSNLEHFSLLQLIPNLHGF